MRSLPFGLLRFGAVLLLRGISAVSARVVVRASSASFELGASGRKPTHMAIFICPEKVIDSIIILLVS